MRESLDYGQDSVKDGLSPLIGSIIEGFHEVSEKSLDDGGGSVDQNGSDVLSDLGVGDGGDG